MSPDSELAKILQVYSIASDAKDENLKALCDEALDYGFDAGTNKEAWDHCLKKFEESQQIK